MHAVKKTNPKTKWPLSSGPPACIWMNLFLKEASNYPQAASSIPSGAIKRGENWRCGVLISDDDGQSWCSQTVGYEPDLAIRDNPQIPAGFNEQTLFYTQDGLIVSIIRGREALGRAAWRRQSRYLVLPRRIPRPRRYLDHTRTHQPARHRRDRRPGSDLARRLALNRLPNPLLTHLL